MKPFVLLLWACVVAIVVSLIVAYVVEYIRWKHSQHKL